MKVSQLLLDMGMVKSKSEAKRLIKQKAVEIDGKKVTQDAEVIFVGRYNPEYGLVKRDDRKA